MAELIYRKVLEEAKRRYEEQLKLAQETAKSLKEEDVYKLMDVVEGVVVGKALYEGKINLKVLLLS